MIELEDLLSACREWATLTHDDKKVLDLVAAGSRNQAGRGSEALLSFVATVSSLDEHMAQALFEELDTPNESTA